jgi:hypothetical protein
VCSIWIMGKTESQGLASVHTKRSVKDTLIIVGCFDTYVQRLPMTSTLMHQHDAYIVTFLTLITDIFRLAKWEPDEGGSYFLDTDPNLFEHLRRFMRRPEVFPLFYNHAAGFDYDLYNRLEAEAGYFQIDALYKWIKAKV